MATSAATAAHMLDAMSGAAGVSVRKMFGEYGVFLDGRMVAVICDDQLFLRPTPGTRALLPDVVEAIPFHGAKPYLLLGDELDDSDLIAAALNRAAQDLPLPKPKSPRKKA